VRRHTIGSYLDQGIVAEAIVGRGAALQPKGSSALTTVRA
jgi:hypothetical protein